MGSNYVYKRRTLRNSIALLSMPGEDDVFHSCDCCNSSDGTKPYHLKLLEDLTGAQKRSLNSSRGKHLSGDGLNVHVYERLIRNHSSKIGGIDSSCKRAEENHHKANSDKSFSVNSSTSHSQLKECSTLKNVETNDLGECSSSVGIVSEQPVSDFISSTDLCMRVLKANGLSASPENAKGVLDPSSALGGNNAELFLSCKSCGCMGNNNSMLICDFCEEAFHLHCCREKAPFREEWFCRPCSGKKPRSLLDNALGNSSIIISEEYKRRILQKELGPIQFMLKDFRPYTSRVRAGKNFQVDVPEWSTPTYRDCDSFVGTSLLDRSECCDLNVHNFPSLPRLCSLGNWVQCRDVTYKNMDKHNGGVICGKWRRAPFSVIQTDDWDCSCAVLWDPAHADCAVPQELETEEVLKQLKFVEKVRYRLKRKELRCRTK